MSSRRRTWFLLRLAIYVAVVAVLFATRGVPDWKKLGSFLGGSADGPAVLTVAGSELAPRLIPSLIASYRQDYPDLTVRLTAGGTNQALEDLLNRRADAAFLLRAPSAAEQDQLRAVDGDTAVVVPVAVGGMAVVTAVDADTSPLDLDEVRRLVTRGHAAGCTRLYVPDPNEGLWDVVGRRLGLADRADAVVVFVADAEAVTRAVAADSGACGLVSTLTVDLASRDDVAVRPVRADADAPPTRPSYANLVTGDYPLHHKLYVACRAAGGIEGTNFVTHLASDRGQRQVRRAGAVPARNVAREIVITRDPPGS